MTSIADKEKAINSIKTAIHLGAPEKNAVIMEAMLDEMLNKKCDCKSKKEKVVKEKTPHQKFMSGCMTGKGKGGQGKSMKECVVEYTAKKEKGEING